MKLPRELSEWLSRRRRFREEWDFHREMAIAEFEALGLSRTEATRLAERRLGSYFAHRRSALRQLRAQITDLLDVLPWCRIRSSALLVPAIVLLTLAAIVLPNPHRLEVLANTGSLVPFLPNRHVDRFVPLTPSNLVPMAFPDVMLWGLTLIGLARVAATPKFRRQWRIWAFTAATLVPLVVLSAALWTTALPLLMKDRWHSDALQGLALVTFCFAYSGWAFLVFKVWYRDLLSRCPICLRRLGMAELRGNSADLLIAPLERETICLYGHGVNLESHWSQTFEVDRSTKWPA